MPLVVAGPGVPTDELELCCQLGMPTRGATEGVVDPVDVVVAVVVGAKLPVNVGTLTVVGKFFRDRS